VTHTAPVFQTMIFRSAAILAWMVEEKKIAPHVPVWDKGERADGTFSRSDFVFDAWG
jgi:hypothetical protein